MTSNAKHSVTLDNNGEETVFTVLFEPEASYSLFSMISTYNKGFYAARSFAAVPLSVDMESGIITLGEITVEQFFTRGNFFTLHKGTNQIDIFATTGTMTITYRKKYL